MKTKNSKEKIINDYEKIVKFVIKDMNLGHRYDELYDVGIIGFVNGINTFDETRGVKQITYLYDCIKNEICHYLEAENRVKRKGTTISLNTLINESTELIDLIPTYQDYDRDLYLEEIYSIIDRRLAKLSERDEKIFKHLYGIDGYEKLESLQLEKKFNMSRQNVIRIRNKVLNMLRYEIKDYYRTYQEILSNKNKM